jgi:small subunit ribosomal protein S2
MNTNQISLMSLFQVGAHRGNRKSKLNPRLRSKVHGFSKGLCQIDLASTNTAIDASVEILKKLGAKKRQVLIVGTSKHISPLVVDSSTKFSSPMPYVNNRWLGGTLTNWSTIRRTLKDKEKKEKIVNNVDFFAKLARNEQLGIQRQLDKLKTIFDGLTPLKTNRPGAIIVLDADENKVSIREAQSLGIPVITLTNTSTVFLPNNLNSTICVNTNSIKAVELVLAHLVEAYNSGVATAAAQATVAKEEKKEETKKPV